MNTRDTLKRDLLNQLERDIDQFLPASRRTDESGRTARQALLHVILESLPWFPSELRPPALRRGDYYHEIALAIVECPDPSFLFDKRIRFSMYRVLRYAEAWHQSLLQLAVDSNESGPEHLAHYSTNVQLMLQLPVAIIRPNDFDLED